MNACRTCYKEIDIYGLGLWEGYCSDCGAQAKRRRLDDEDSTSQDWQHTAQNLEQDNVSLSNDVGGNSYYSTSSEDNAGDPVSCKECRAAVEWSSSGHWKCLCWACANRYKSKVGSHAAHIQKLKSEVRELKEELKGDDNVPSAKDTFCLGCGNDFRKEGRTNVLELQQRVRELESAYKAKDERIQELEEQLETRDRGRRQEIHKLHGAIRRRIDQVNTLQSDIDAAKDEVNGLKQEKMYVSRYFESRLDELRSESSSLKSLVSQMQEEKKKHDMSCPAQSNNVMLQVPKFSDICVTAGNEVFHLHRAILATRSSMFAYMLNSPRKEGSDRHIEILDMTPGSLKEFIHFIYTGKFSDTFDLQLHGGEILAAGFKYDVGCLVKSLGPLLGVDVPCAVAVSKLSETYSWPPKQK